MKITPIFLALFLLCSCAKESITPAYVPEVYSEQAMQFKLSINEIEEVDEFAEDIGEVPVVGEVFQRLAGMFADISIDDENGTEVAIDPVYFNMPELQEIDFNIFKRISLDQVHLKIADEEITPEESTLSFIKRIEVYINLDPEEPAPTPSHPESDDEGAATSSKINENSLLFLVFDKDRDPLRRRGQSLLMRVRQMNWKQILMKTHRFSIETKLVVDSVPKGTLGLGGDIKFSVVLDKLY